MPPTLDVTLQTPPKSVHAQIQMARSTQERDRAARFVYDIYRERGLLAQELSFQEFDRTHRAHRDDMTFIVRDLQSNPIGTVTTLYDSGNGLPADQTFPRLLHQLRTSGRRLVEVARFAVSHSAGNRKAIRLNLINNAFIHAARVREYTDLIIEVHPRHAPFYQRFLLFEVFGPQRPCARVNSAPAVLLRLKLEKYVGIMKLRSLPGPMPLSLRKTLYASFAPLTQERKIQRAMRKLLSALKAHPTTV